VEEAFEDFELNGVGVHLQMGTGAKFGTCPQFEESVAFEPEVAFCCATAIGARDRPVISHGVGHFAIKDKVVDSAGLILGICFEMDRPFINR
jgi:hypothetical protein